MLLIIGGDSLIGREVSSFAKRADIPAICTSRHPNADYPLDLLGDPQAWSIPDAEFAVLCAGMTSHRACMESPSLSETINVDRLKTLVTKLRSQGTRVIFPSTNLVLGGAKPWLTENTPRQPLTVYAEHKAEIERNILETDSGCVLRISKIAESLHIVQNWLQALNNNEQIQPFLDAVISPVPALLVAEQIVALTKTAPEGIFHLSALYDVSYADIASELQKLTVSGHIASISYEDADQVLESFPEHTVLDCERLKQTTGAVIPDPIDVIRQYYGTLLNGPKTPTRVDKIRKTPMPRRNAFGPTEERMLLAATQHFKKRNEDPSYQGPFQLRYEHAFSRYMGGGESVAVATGTAAVYVAVAALGLPRGSNVIAPPITDPGSLSGIVLHGHSVTLADAAPNSYNVGVAEFEAAITPQTKAALIVHAAGEACPMREIMEIAGANDILVIEDCSQAHGATYCQQKAGTYGHLSIFSTMSRKAHIMGGSGGIIYSQNTSLIQLARAHADRGKPVWQDGFDSRNPNTSLFPALNLNSNDLNCAIGLASLSRLSETMQRRCDFISKLKSAIHDECSICQPYDMSDEASPFFFPVFLDTEKLNVTKKEFASAILAEGIDLNPHYGFLVCDWPWLSGYFLGERETPNARHSIDNSFNLYVNENYGVPEIEDIINALLHVEERFSKQQAC